MKKFINDVENVENEILEGIVLAHPEYVFRLKGFDVLVRADKKIDKVALVSGGGSGHEPSHDGYVGTGMLDAAVAGSVYTSPTPDQIFEAIKAVDAGKGVLLVIKNYTGDIMNFEMASELAEDEGIKVLNVVVNDDVAVEDSLYTTGRRGVAGTVFVHKIAGAKAETGADLEAVKKIAEKVIVNVRTMGVALKPSTVPAAGKPGFELTEKEMEIGIGIHGEPGIKRKPIQTADGIVDILMGHILKDMNLSSGDEVAVMVNGSGGTPPMELYILNRRVQQILSDKEVKVFKTFVGDYMTSLDMAGASITLLKLDDELKELLSAKADTIGMKI